MIEPKCPNCGDALKRSPQRKTKCPSCSEYIYFKCTPDNLTKRVMSAAQAAAADAAWDKRAEDQRVRDFCRMWGVNEDHFRKGVSETGGDVNTIMRGELLLVMASDPEVNRRAFAAHVLAQMEGRDGGDFLPMLRERARLTLQALPRNVIKRVEIKPGGCMQSTQLIKYIMSIDEALDKMPIPHPQCHATSRDGRLGFCTCSYAPIFENER